MIVKDGRTPVDEDDHDGVPLLLAAVLPMHVGWNQPFGGSLGRGAGRRRLAR